MALLHETSMMKLLMESFLVFCEGFWRTFSKFKYFVVLFTAFCVFNAQIIFAEQRETLDRLISDAIKTNPAVKVQQAEVEAANAILQSAAWQKYPSVSVGFEQNTENDDATALIAVEQPIWTGGKLTAGELIGRAAVEEETKRLREVVDTLVSDVVDKYYDVIRFDARVNERKAAETELKRLVAIVEARVSAKVSPRSDLAQAEARYYQAMRDRLTAEEQYVSARAQLDRLVGRGVNKLADRTPLSFNYDLDYLLEQSLRKSSKLGRLSAAIERARSEVKSSDANFFPDIKIGIRSSSSDVFGGSEFSEGIAFLSADYNSGAGFSMSSDQEASLARLKSSQAELEYEASKLHEESLILWRKKESLSTQIAPLRKLEVASRNIFQSNLKQFQVGKRSWLDVLNSVREMTDSALSRIDAEVGLETTLAKMILMTKEPNALFPDYESALVLR